jgi:hypothetical protein
MRFATHLGTQWNLFSSLWKNSSVDQPTSILFKRQLGVIGFGFHFQTPQPSTR